MTRWFQTAAHTRLGWQIANSLGRSILIRFVRRSSIVRLECHSEYEMINLRMFYAQLYFYISTSVLRLGVKAPASDLWNLSRAVLVLYPSSFTKPEQLNNHLRVIFNTPRTVQIEFILP